MTSLAPATPGARAGCLGRGLRVRGGAPWQQAPGPASAGGDASSSAPGRTRPRPGRLAACLAPAAAAGARCGARRPGQGRARRGLAVVASAVDEDYDGPAVELTSATVRRGSSLVLDEVELEVPRGARAVIVGPNGCGKTTLLSAIAGREPVENGTLHVGAPTVGWLRQEAVGGSKRTVFAEAVLEMPAMRFKEQMQAAEARFAEAADGTPDEVSEAQEAYDEALGKFVALGGDTIQRRAEEVLTGLGFVAQDFQRPCSELSGGWQMRVALARALLREPALLLLDEPTNHMDSAAKRWLASHLAGGLSKDVTMLLVTHDRSLLQDIRCTHVIEIAEKRIVPYMCSGILQWEKKRAERVKYLYNEMDKLQKQIDKAQAWVNRFGAKATLASRANSMKKEIQWNKEKYQKFKDETRGLPSADEVLGKSKNEKVDMEAATDGTLPLSAPSRVNLKLPDPPLMMEPPVDGVLVSIKEADVGYEGSTPIVSDVDINVSTSTCLAILGPNGTGKTTLLRTLAGTMQAQAGARRVGVGGLRKAKVALFTQDLAQDLPSKTTPVDYVLEGAPMSLDTQGARAALGALGLRAEVHMSEIGNLSGGEKARVALAVFTTRPSDVLLLDEPTNHLDGAAVSALSAGLVEHAKKGGAIVVASHDKAFVQSLKVTDVASVSRGAAGEAGSVRLDAGPLPEAHSPDSGPSPLAAEAIGGANSANVAEVAVAEAPLHKPEKKAAQKAAVPATSAALAFKAKIAAAEAEELMESIEKQEEELEEAQQAMRARWTEEKYETVQRLEEELQAAYERWEGLAETIQAATS